MGRKVLVGALALVFLATGCGPIKNKKEDKPEDVVTAGFNSGFGGAIYFDNKESYQRLDMRSGQSENFLASGPKMTSASIGGDRFITVKRSRSYPEILIMGRNKEPIVRIALPENPEGTPKLSRNGEFILIGGIAGDTKIYNLSGQVVTNLRTNVSSYDWLADGRVIFSRFGTIYIMEPDFKSYKVYHQMAGAVSSLAVSPDGNYLAFEMKTSSGSHIWTLNLGSEVLRQITTSNIGEHFPAWSPSSHHLVVAKGKLAEADLIDNDKKTKVQGCLELWVVNAYAEAIGDLSSEDLANTFLVKQNVEGKTSETCAMSAPLWLAQ